MKFQWNLRKLFPLLYFILTSAPAFAVHDMEEWRRRTTGVAEDTTLTDSLKVVKISDLTYNYFYYYRVFNEEYLDEYLQLAERLAGNNEHNDLLSYIYGTAVVIARSGDKMERIKEKCEYHTARSTNPLIRSQSWERLGRKYITDAAGLDYLSKALEAVEGRQEYAAESRIYSYIAFYYSNQGDKKNETNYAARSLELAKQSGNARQLATALESMAEAYYFGNDYPAAIETYNKVRDIYLDSLKTQETDEDLRYRDDVHYMVTLVNLGTMYYYNSELSTAAGIMNEALETAKRHHIVETEAYCHKELGRIYTDLKQFAVAQTHLLEAERLLLTDYVSTAESNYIDYEVKLALAYLYDLTGKYRQSAGYYREGIRKYRDLHDEEQMAVNQQLAAGYETRRQEEAIERMETVMSYHERRRLLYAAILIVALLMLFFVARLYRTRIALAQQKEQAVRDRARLLKLRNRKAELDGQLKDIEAESLKQKLEMGNQLREDRNKSLDDITAFFGKHPELARYQAQVQNIMLQQNRIDNNVDEYRKGMNSVPLDFYVRLQKVSGNKLTSLDLKYCRLIYLETSTKDIAELLSVEPKTVRMTKYRLKQKLGLGKEEDLNEFICNITQN